ncbi:MAG: hypothetical protein ABJZ55_18300 [Fuerstiella sp.]
MSHSSNVEIYDAITDLSKQEAERHIRRTTVSRKILSNPDSDLASLPKTAEILPNQLG